jgi:hypothetical protein
VWVRCRNGERQQYWVCTKVVRLKRYGRKRVVMVHETATLSDAPRFLLTEALHGESGRVMEMWSYRWAAEIFHEFAKQVPGLESAQVRKEEAFTRHFRLGRLTTLGVSWAPPRERLIYAGRVCRDILAHNHPISLIGLFLRYCVYANRDDL